jgi:hypothetical protein
MATSRLPVAPAPGPLEDYLAEFDPVLVSRAQRAAIRDYVVGLLRPRERNKTLTALADTEPGVGSKHREEQRLQWFLSESPWDHQAVNDRRIELLVADPRTAPHEDGALVVDDSGDRKSGHATAFVSRQYLGSRGKVEEGIVAVTTCWADEKVYWPVHTIPYRPAPTLPGGRKDPEFRTKAQLASQLVNQARDAGIRFRALVADADYGPNRARRMVVATTDPKTLPGTSTRYLATNLPRRPRRGPHRPATLAEILRLYSLRNWIEQEYKQVKHELGWADFQVRSGEAIQRHWTLVNLAFSFSWRKDNDKPGASAKHPEPGAAGSELDTWPQRLRRIRSWLVPFHDLLRIIRSGVLVRVPREINRLTARLACGQGINLYLPP